MGVFWVFGGARSLSRNGEAWKLLWDNAPCFVLPQLCQARWKFVFPWVRLDHRGKEKVWSKHQLCSCSCSEAALEGMQTAQGAGAVCLQPGAQPGLQLWMGWDGFLTKLQGLSGVPERKGEIQCV